jgi:hypothetical protein
MAGPDSASLSPDFLDQTTALDPSLFDDNLVNEDQMNEPDLLSLFYEDMEWDSGTAETDATSLVADADVDCDIHDGGRVQRLHKTRRGASCSSPPMGGSEQMDPNRPNKSSFDFKAFIDQKSPETYFAENTVLCPEAVFKKAIIPVLENDALSVSPIKLPPYPWVHLIDVLPCKLICP